MREIPQSQIELLISLSASDKPLDWLDSVTPPPQSNKTPLLFGRELQTEIFGEESILNARAKSNIAELMTRYTPRESLTPAGYTYFGQFITHDIVSSTTLGNSRKYATPELNLDSLYFEEDDPRWEYAVDDLGRFHLGDSEIGLNTDLFRVQQADEISGDIKFPALIPEHRNDGTVILSQFHLLWQKVHNLTIEKYLDTSATGSKRYNYRLAKKFVILLFQTVVVEDYLKTVLYPKVHSHYFMGDPSLHYAGFSKVKSLPREYILGVSRMGHAMVREDYDLNTKARINLHEIFNKNRPITKRLEVDWAHLLTDGNRASRLDWRMPVVLRSLAHEDLDQIPIDLVDERVLDALRKGGKKLIDLSKDLVFLDFEASESLPSAGQVLDAHFSQEHPHLKDAAELWDFPGFRSRLERSAEKFFSQAGLNISKKDVLNKLPFFLFMLIEASVFPLSDGTSSSLPRNSQEVDQFVKHDATAYFGPFASIVLAETMLFSINWSKWNINMPWAKLGPELGLLAQPYSELCMDNRPLRMLDVMIYFKLTKPR